MKIGYKKKHLNVNLIFGIIWLIYGIIRVIDNEKPNWIDYGWFVFSAIYFGTYFYKKKEKYLTIENGVLRINSPFGKILNLNEIKHIKKFAGDYILKTDKTELTINTQIIDPNSLAELNSELEKLNLEWK